MNVFSSGQERSICGDHESVIVFVSYQRKKKQQME